MYFYKLSGTARIRIRNIVFRIRIRNNAKFQEYSFSQNLNQITLITVFRWEPIYAKNGILYVLLVDIWLGFFPPAFSGHDPVDPGIRQTSLHIPQVLDVAVGEHRHSDGVPHGTNMLPAGQS